MTRAILWFSRWGVLVLAALFAAGLIAGGAWR
jgi:hypothetical protein